VTKAAPKLANPTRRASKAPLDVAIAQLEEAIRTGVVDSDAGNRVIDQLRRSRPDITAEANGGRREHILAVAARVFARKGFRATSLQEIAGEVGVTRPSFYYHFRSKQEILAAILFSALERAEQAIDGVLAGPGNTVDRLRAFVFRYVEVNTQNAEVPVLFQSAGELEPDEAKIARQRRSDIDHKLAGLVKEGVERGELRSSAPLISAYGLLGAINWMHTWYRTDGLYTPDEVAEMLADLLLYGIVTDEARKSR
jgi:AcrR family transcriptional regulator